MGLGAELIVGLSTATMKAIYLYHSRKDSGVMNMKYLGGCENDNGGTGWVMRSVPDAGAQSTAAVFCTNGEVYDTSDHVEEQCGA